MKSRIRLPSKVFLVSLLFLSGTILAFPVFPLLDCTCSADRARSVRDQIKMIWLRYFAKILGLKVKQQGALPLHTGLVVSNHVSWLDIIVIGQYLPAYFVAKSDILGWPVIGYMAKQAGTIFIRRGDKKNILITAEKMLSLLARQANIIAFPEGTTTAGGDVLSFHASLFQPAIQSKAMVQPVAIRYHGKSQSLVPFIGDDAFVPHLLKMLREEAIDVELVFLDAIDPSEKSRNAVCDEARGMIVQAVQKWSETA